MTDKLITNKIVGGGKSDQRKALDFYPTPKEVTIALLDFLQIPKSVKIWEPACGNNHMVDVIRNHGYEVIGTDIQSGVDFLTAELPEGVEWIITNPPFNISENFIVRALYHNKPFALLLKSQYWHAQKREMLFRISPPTYILPLTWRPDFTGQKASLMDMMWCVWDKRPFGVPYAQYIPLSKPDRERLKAYENTRIH